MRLLTPVIVAIVAFLWVSRAPKFDWEPAPVLKEYPKCPSGTSSKLLLFGGTSMLGRYIVDTWLENEPKVCIINYSRKTCPKCHVSIYGDMRDVNNMDRVLEHYKPETVLTSTKPPLEGAHYRDFIEINVAAIKELIKCLV